MLGLDADCTHTGDGPLRARTWNGDQAGHGKVAWTHSFLDGAELFELLAQRALLSVPCKATVLAWLAISTSSYHTTESGRLLKLTR